MGINRIDQRLKEAEKLGFTDFVIMSDQLEIAQNEGIQDKNAPRWATCGKCLVYFDFRVDKWLYNQVQTDESIDYLALRTV